MVSCLSQVLYSTAFTSIVFYHHKIISTWWPMWINYETSELKMSPNRPSFPYTRLKILLKWSISKGGYFKYASINKSILNTMEICRIYLGLCPQATIYLIGGKQNGKAVKSKCCNVSNLNLPEFWRIYFQVLRYKESAEIFLCHWWLLVNHCWYKVFARDCKMLGYLLSWMALKYMLLLPNFGKLRQW